MMLSYGAGCVLIVLQLFAVLHALIEYCLHAVSCSTPREVAYTQVASCINATS